jgi:hypothetical protein
VNQFYLLNLIFNHYLKILKYFLDGRPIYPCDLVDLYLTNISSIPTDRSFDYMIKSRYLNIVPLDSRIVLDKNQLAQAIRYSWYIRNSQAINITQYDVILSEYGFYTSIFKEYTFFLDHLDFKLFSSFLILVYYFY